MNSSVYIKISCYFFYIIESLNSESTSNRLTPVLSQPDVYIYHCFYFLLSFILYLCHDLIKLVIINLNIRRLKMISSTGLGCRVLSQLECCPSLFLSVRIARSLSPDSFAYLLLFILSFCCTISQCLWCFIRSLRINYNCLNSNPHLLKILALEGTLQYSSLINLLCWSHLNLF
jgi:hypothetical protein